jgi:hypothetical protein
VNGLGARAPSRNVESDRLGRVPIADFTWTDLWGGALVALVGACGGAVAAWWLTKRARSEERAHQQRVRVRDREIEAAVAMDEALLRMGSLLPAVGAPDAARGYGEAYDAWDHAWRRSAVLGDDDLLGRYRVVGTMLWMAFQDAGRAAGSSQTRGSLLRAIGGARQALAAFRREEPLPQPIFPTTNSELFDLVPTRGVKYDYQPLEEWLRRHSEG